DPGDGQDGLLALFGELVGSVEERRRDDLEDARVEDPADHRSDGDGDERPEDPVTQLAQMFDEGHTTLGIGGASAPEPAAPLALAHCGPMGVARVLLSPAAGQVPARLAAAVPAARRAARPAAGRAAAA